MGLKLISGNRYSHDVTKLVSSRQFRVHVDGATVSEVLSLFTNAITIFKNFVLKFVDRVFLCFLCLNIVSCYFVACGFVFGFEYVVLIFCRFLLFFVVSSVLYTSYNYVHRITIYIV